MAANVVLGWQQILHVPRTGKELFLPLGVGGWKPVRLRSILACGLAREMTRLGASGGRAGENRHHFEQPGVRPI
jgi:hypothetical protein